MNSAGADEPALGMLPAQQRLRADAARVGERHDRLEEQAELAALERAVQRVLGRVRAPARACASCRRTPRPVRGRAPWRGTSRRRRRGAAPRGARHRTSPSAMPTLAPTNISVPRTTIGRMTVARSRSRDLDRLVARGVGREVLAEDRELVAAEPGHGVAGTDHAPRACARPPRAARRRRRGPGCR